MTDFQAEIEANQTDRAAVANSSVAPGARDQLRHGSKWGGLSLDPTSVLYVSLFLVLFAFFVVLNVNADEKVGGADAVMASLRDAFGGEVNGAQTSRLKVEDLDPALLKARKAVLSNIPNALVTMPQIGDAIEVSLPLSGFFVESTTRLAPSRELLLKSISTLASTAEHQPFAIGLVFSVSDADLESQRRVAAIAAALGKYGMNPGSLTITGKPVVAGENTEAKLVRFVMRRG